MLLKLFTNINGCILDLPKYSIFGESNTGAASKVKSPCNLDFDTIYLCLGVHYSLRGCLFVSSVPVVIKLVVNYVFCTE